MGKSSINGPFSVAMLNNQRVYIIMSYSFDSFDLPAVALTLGVACLFQPGSKHMTEKHGKNRNCTYESDTV